jgi:UDP-glucuronate 4-epimerase
MKVLITGTAGFIGYHLVDKLTELGHEVVGLDNINDYYELSLKYSRLKNQGVFQEEIEYNKKITSKNKAKYSFIKLNLEDYANMLSVFKNENFDVVINLAAQAGVRHSLEDPHVYVSSNLVGFMNILECCRHTKVKHLLYASSSSVYGLNESFPFSTHNNVDHPISIYAASKKANELMAHSYSYLYNLPTTGLRFFSVYGTWGRPDMALFQFTKAILAGNPIEVYNNGEMERDFTYVDDIVSGIVKIASKTPEPNPLWDGKNPDPASSPAPYRIYNIGNNKPVMLLDFIKAIERELGLEAKMIFKPMQPGDVAKTCADANDIIEEFGYMPGISVNDGVGKFVKWYKSYYKQ